MGTIKVSDFVETLITIRVIFDQFEPALVSYYVAFAEETDVQEGTHKVIDLGDFHGFIA